MSEIPRRCPSPCERRALRGSGQILGGSGQILHVCGQNCNFVGQKKMHHPGQEVVNEGRIASGGLIRLFGELADEPIGDPGLAGKGNSFLGGQDAIDCPELEAGGQDATQGGRGAEGLFSAGRGLGQWLVGVAARIGCGPVAEQVVVGAAAAGEGHRVVVVEGRDLIADRLGERGHF